jgi:hypothetical protein
MRRREPSDGRRYLQTGVRGEDLPRLTSSDRGPRRVAKLHKPIEGLDKIPALPGLPRVSCKRLSVII